jgi:hypothetical protein
MAATVDRITTVNVKATLEDIWMDQSNVEQARMLWGSAEKDLQALNAEKGKSLNFTQPILITITQFYVEVFSQIPKPGLLISSQFDSFTDSVPSNISSEIYTALHELCALVKIVGIDGVQFIDEKLSRLVTVNLSAVSFWIQEHEQFLTAVKSGDFSGFAIAAKSKVKDCMQSLINVGSILKFKNLLSKATQKVL